MISTMFIIVLLSLSMGSVLSYATDDYDPNMLRPYLPIFNNSSKRPSGSTKRPIDSLFIRRRERKLSQQEGKKIDINASKKRRMRRRNNRSAVSLSNNDDYDPNLLRPYVPIHKFGSMSPSASTSSTKSPSGSTKSPSGSTKSPSGSTKNPSQSTKKPIDNISFFVRRRERTALEADKEEIVANASKRRNLRRKTRVQVVRKQDASS